MKRREFITRTLPILGLAPFWATLLSHNTEAASIPAPRKEAWRNRIRAILDRGRLPIVDMQATYVEGKTNVSRLMQFMDEHDVAQVAFAAAFAADSRPSLDLHKRYPEYFIPVTNSGEFERWWRDPLRFLDTVKSDLASGDYYFMGEYEFRHYPSPEQVKAGATHRDITVDITSAAGEALFKLSEETGVTFQIHYEIEDQLLDPLEAMLRRYPKARLIWCHLGQIRYPQRAQRYGSDYVAHLINQFPGLYFDLAVSGPDYIYPPSGAYDATIYGTNGRLAKNWRELIERHPDRFLMASDYRPPVESYYPDQIRRQRRLILDTLSEPVQRKLAFENAWQLLTAEQWQV